MSYILDALKKAETERNLGEIPGIHAQPLHLASRVPERSWRHDPWRWTALICVVLLIGLAAWKWWPSAGEPLHPIAMPVMPVTPVPHSEPLPPIVQAARTPVSRPPPSAPEHASVQGQNKPAAKASHKKERRTKHPASATEAPTPSPQAAAETPLSEIPELPPDVQREIPTLTIGGYIYSVTPADRSVLINQHLLREGDEISPGLTLEGIRHDGIVLNYKGRRFSDAY